MKSPDVRLGVKVHFAIHTRVLVKACARVRVGIRFGFRLVFEFRFMPGLGLGFVWLGLNVEVRASTRVGVSG